MPIERRLSRRHPALALAALVSLAACSSATPADTPPIAPAVTPAAGAAASPGTSGPAGAAPSAGMVALCDPEAEPGVLPAFEGWPRPGQSQPSAAIPIPASSERVVGPNRFLFTFVDDQNRSLASPDVPVTARFFDVAADPATPVAETAGIFLDTGTTRGLYRTSVDFTCAGVWGVEFRVGLPAGEETPRMLFEVQPEGTTPAVGQPAPRSDSLTASDAQELSVISSDRSPDPDLYRRTIAQAVTSGRPALIAFATPAFCQTAMCGPVLDHVKAVASGYRDRVEFVNVEPYQLQRTPNGPQPVLSPEGQPLPVQAVLDYGLRTEPFIFVVDAGGKVAAKFEGAVDETELRAALDAVIGA